MSSLNKVIIVGNLGRDPEVRKAASGAAVCNIAVATSRTWKDKTSGERKVETEWHRITLFDRLAEIAGDYLKKGRLVYIEGRLKTRKYVDKDGVENYATDIIATEMQLLGGMEAGTDEQQGGLPQSKPVPRGSAPVTGGRPSTYRREAQVGQDAEDDDIPF
jgi:single-strand DNA-binding protein